MGHVVRIQNLEQYKAALRVLDKLPGTWQSRGPSESAVLLVLDSHYEALVRAGVIPANGKESRSRGKKTPAKKIES